jgi:asparagine synthase (glutamine-hydrolysing)
MVSFKDETYFECLRTLPERSNLTFKDGEVTVAEYWDIDPSNKFHGSFEEKRQRFLELFRDSIRLHMRSDVEVGGCLSGGLDSSAIASVVATDFDQASFKTFSIYYEGEGQMDERPWIREVLRGYPHLQPIFRSPTEEDVAAAFDHALILHDVPMPMSPPISFYLVMQLARQHGIKVMLDGQGSDEYLGGYAPSLYQLIDWPSLSSEPVPELDKKKVGASRLKQYLHDLMFSDPLPALLHYGDRMSMAFSIESRVPFLDHRLVEFVHSLEDEDIFCQGQTKHILRTSLAGLLPNAISARKNKQPFFGREIVSWLRGPLRWLTEAQFDFERLGIFNASKVRELIGAFNGGDDTQSALVWKLAGLNYWAQKQ